MHVLVRFYLCSILGGGEERSRLGQRIQAGPCRSSDCPLHIYTFGGDFYFFSLSASFKGSILSYRGCCGHPRVCYHLLELQGTGDGDRDGVRSRTRH